MEDFDDTIIKILFFFKTHDHRYVYITHKTVH